MADVLERDAGFCSGGDEDDMEVEDGIHSPTDASEDSVDVKVQAISLRNRNKRKCAEPRRLDTDLPAKKRKIDSPAVKEVEQSSQSPFRPWSASPTHKDDSLTRISMPDRSVAPQRNTISSRTVDLTIKGQNVFNVISFPRLPPTHPRYTSPGGSPLDVKPYPLYLSNSPDNQEEPLSLVSKRKDNEDRKELTSAGKPIVPDVRLPPTTVPWLPTSKESPTLNSKSHSGKPSDRGNYLSRVKLAGKTNDDKTLKPEDFHQSDNKFRIDSLLSSSRTEGSSGAYALKSSQGGQQRNYKNMTRERRIEANARERTRVHTISAAFDTLRHSIPAYSHNQKLSKLSVLRIACSYIMTLSRLAGYDYSKDRSEPNLSNCVENVSKTIQTEGKIRKKKED